MEPNAANALTSTFDPAVSPVSTADAPVATEPYSPAGTAFRLVFLAVPMIPADTSMFDQPLACSLFNPAVAVIDTSARVHPRGRGC